jgi:hypothetical protein
MIKRFGWFRDSFVVTSPQTTPTNEAERKEGVNINPGVFYGFINSV